MIDPPHLVLLPGLGIDSRVYRPQEELPLRVELADWIKPESPRETLAHYAIRMTAKLKLTRDCTIGGISLGAMVALEAARNSDVRGVIAIGGCDSPAQIAPFYRMVLEIGAMLPASGVRLMAAVAPLALRAAENLTPSQILLMKRMLHEHPPEQIRWGCRAILEWEDPRPLYGVPVYRIHGEKDECIPIQNVRPLQIVRGAHHLINLSHAPEVNRFIEQHASPAESSHNVAVANMR